MLLFIFQNFILDFFFMTGLVMSLLNIKLFIIFLTLKIF